VRLTNIKEKGRDKQDTNADGEIETVIEIKAETDAKAKEEAERERERESTELVLLSGFVEFLFDLIGVREALLRDFVRELLLDGLLLLLAACRADDEP
jgi:hypothetical protein